MPLIKSKSKKAFKENVRRKIKAGKPKKQAVIPEVYVPTATGGSQSGTTVILSGNKLFLPSEVEIYGNSSNSHAGEGTQFDYYVGTANSAKIKKIDTSNQLWWLRSPSRASANAFVRVIVSGGATTITATNPLGVSPCFAL